MIEVLFSCLNVLFQLTADEINTEIPVNEKVYQSDEASPKQAKSRSKGSQKLVTINLTSRSHNPTTVTSTPLTSVTSPVSDIPVAAAWPKSPTPQKSPVSTGLPGDVGLGITTPGFSLREIMEEENRRQVDVSV